MNRPPAPPHRCPALAPPGSRSRAASLLLALALALAMTILQSPAAEPPPVVRVKHITGTAQVLSPTNPVRAWNNATNGQPLQPGDRFRTATRSSAVLLLTDLSQLHLGEESEYEILPPPRAGLSPIQKLWRGVIYLFHRGKPGDQQWESPTSAAAVRGTEFVLRVEGNGRTILTVLEGGVDLSNAAGSQSLRTGDQGVVEAGKAPAATPLLQAQLVESVQWALYYPGVLHPPDLALNAAERELLRDSLAAWQAGDLLASASLYPAGRSPASEAERLYRAALHLAVGNVEAARPLLNSPQQPVHREIADALRRLIEVVLGRPVPPVPPPASASALLAESYVHQSRSDLSAALATARAATERAPDFAFAWARVAELEFGQGQTTRSEAALARALARAPRHAQGFALQGFLAAARNEPHAAIGWFDQALALDGGLGNAWLGRGLARIRQGHRDAGLEDLQTAVTMEPLRSVLRSYLGKAYDLARRDALAGHELELAIRLDPRDPTPWLYRALLERNENRINDAIASLERSTALNDERDVYRSRLLLEQDRAVRGANIARIYQDAGMNDVSLNAASRAVASDYANASAHLFLADSYDALRDPTRFNLRYETVWFNEQLLGNLLAPVGAGQLSQHVSQQEYSRLFEQDRLGLFSSTEYRSDGQFRQLATQSGLFRDTAWALDLDYQHNDGVRPNNDLERIDWYSTIQHQFSPRDSALLIVRYQDYTSGDNFQYYDPAAARPDLRIEASQKPTLIGGYHHEWAPGVHTLAVAGRLESDQQVTDRNVPFRVLNRDTNNQVADVTGLDLDLDYHSRYTAWTAEAQQIFQTGPHSLLFGARYQSGEFDTTDVLTVSDPADSFYLGGQPLTQDVSPGFERYTGYGYYTLQPVPSLRLTAGLAYDALEYPDNFRRPPIQDGLASQSQFSPKAALVWDVTPAATVRAAYSQSLGGVSFDESVRLEPAQLAGFSQAFRTVIPESVAGSVSAPRFETMGAALDWRLPTRTYFTLLGESLREKVNQDVGAFDLNVITPVVPTALQQRLDFEENSVLVSLHQLLGREWVLGGAYRYAEASLDTTYPDLPSGVAATQNSHEQARLHRARIYAAWYHPSGFLARAETDWYSQHNSGYDGTRPGDDFLQYNLYVGYRFPRRRAEILLGVLNLTDQDYRLNPLNAYLELPRERVFFARLKFDF